MTDQQIQILSIVAPIISPVVIVAFGYIWKVPQAMQEIKNLTKETKALKNRIEVSDRLWSQAHQKPIDTHAIAMGQHDYP